MFRRIRIVSLAALVVSAVGAAPMPALADDGDIIVISGGVAAEGASGQVDRVVFTARLFGGDPSSTAVTARFRTSPMHTTTQPGDATEGTACTGQVDYVRQDKLVTIPANLDPAEVTITVPICGDTADEATYENFAGLLSDVVNAECTSDTCGAIGGITDDDVATASTLSVANDNETEGDGGLMPRRLRFTVTLAPASSNTVTVQANTAPGFASKAVPTASAIGVGRYCFLDEDADFISVSTTLQFDPGQTTKNVDVTICQDTRNELDENLRLVLSNPTNAVIGDGQATGFILDDD